MVLAASRRVRYSDNEFCQSLQPPLVLKPILTFPKGRNKLPCFVKDLFSQSFQPPLVLPRRGDAGYSGSVKDREMLVTLFMITDNSQTAKGICPSPTGEDRWGLMAVSRVTCSFPLGEVRRGFDSTLYIPPLSSPPPYPLRASSPPRRRERAGCCRSPPCRCASLSNSLG